MKTEIRSKILRSRNNLSEDRIKNMSNIIISTFKDKFLSKEYETMCVYVSKDSEVFTHELINYLLDSKNVLVPYIDNVLKVSRIISFSELKKGKFGILEPKEKVEYQGKINLVIVPGVAFDEHGNRLGYGGGYYDNFLKNCSVLRVAFAYEEQIVQAIPAEEHDITMNYIITERRIIKCNQ